MNVHKPPRVCCWVEAPRGIRGKMQMSNRPQSLRQIVLNNAFEGLVSPRFPEGVAVF